MTLQKDSKVSDGYYTGNACNMNLSKHISLNYKTIFCDEDLEDRYQEPTHVRSKLSSKSPSLLR